MNTKHEWRQFLRNLYYQQAETVSLVTPSFKIGVELFVIERNKITISNSYSIISWHSRLLSVIPLPDLAKLTIVYERFIIEITWICYPTVTITLNK